MHEDVLGYSCWMAMYGLCILLDRHKEGLLYTKNKGSDEAIDTEYLSEDENRDHIHQ